MRSYGDFCGVARALSAVGERWALLVVRELLLGPKRFSDLSRALPTLSQNVLSQRLRELEQAGVVTRRLLGPPAGARVYELTPRGRDLEDTLLALGTWGSRQPLPPTGQLSVDALMLALRTTYDPGRAGGLHAHVDLRVAADRFDVEVGPDGVHITRGTAARPAAGVRADVPTLLAVLFGGRPVDDAVAAGDLELHGDRDVAARFLGCFPGPAPA
ncbi:winged helix-turn-helix transcriptional regulator [Micromonospora sp. PLK6-60]|uniref:winged helix-turn-helix transcriptional regulator n=1 Tax=Micromonospora sp. PLK6-60 TaxID=2873383 RepID=UPI001CA68013|nr:winged helix-turn-helix transcriptional regulator [Micromonospora sp. PLK6-60]MBY8875696.1 winged helix-turn-helix transcriptional regulator [Micromonospora sp. PLK6-60]